MLRFIAVSLLVAVSGCVTLLEPQITRNGDTSAYRFVVIPETEVKRSSVTSMSASQYGAYGSSVEKETNPSFVIEGVLLKKGLVRVDNVMPDSAVRTLLARYGQSGRRDVGLGGYTLEVTIAFLDASTGELVFQCTAEGIGATEADDIGIAINRCLESF